MTDTEPENYNAFLDPDHLKTSLIQCSLFLSGYEILKSAILDRLQSFYTHEWVQDEETGELKGIIGAKYKKDVKSLCPKDKFLAACLWFQNSGAISESDVLLIKDLRSHRNFIAHELVKIISSKDQSVDSELVERLIEITRKIDFWWIKEIEIPTDPDFDISIYDEINDQNTFGGNTLTLQIIMSFFEGDDTFLTDLNRQVMDELKKRKG